MPGDDSNIAVTVRAKRSRPAARAPAAEDTEDDGQGSDQEDSPVPDQQLALDTQESDQEVDEEEREERFRQEEIQQEIDRWRDQEREQDGAVVPQEQEQSQSVAGSGDQGGATSGDQAEASSGDQAGPSSGGQSGARKRGRKRKVASNEANKVVRKSTRSRPKDLNK